MEWSFTNSTTTLQPPCKVVTTLQGYEHLAQIATTLSQPCENLTKLEQGCYNLVISIWDWLKNVNSINFSFMFGHCDRSVWMFLRFSTWWEDVVLSTLNPHE